MGMPANEVVNGTFPPLPDPPPPGGRENKR